MPNSPTPLDRMLTLLKTPSLAADLSAEPEVWSGVKRQAEIHRFSGLLANNTSPWLPASERPWRDQVLMTHHRRHVQRLQSLRQLVEAFRHEGIPCVSLKGPLLAERFYADPFLRPSNDLDLLIHENDIGAAARLMLSLGFRLDGRYPWPLHRRFDQHLDFHSPDNSPRVEVHYRLRAGGEFLAASEFMDRSCTWRSVWGFESSVLSPADEAFYSCFHAANHAFHRLRWLYDTVVIANRLTPQERSRLRELALRHAQAGHFVAAALAAREFLGERLNLDCDAFPVPWLWCRLAPRHVRKMVERVEGNTSTLVEKIGYRMDLCRMAGSPLKAAHCIAFGAELEVRKKWYDLRHDIQPETLTRTLPE